MHNPYAPYPYYGPRPTAYSPYTGYAAYDPSSNAMYDLSAATAAIDPTNILGPITDTGPSNAEVLRILMEKLDRTHSERAQEHARHAGAAPTHAAREQEAMRPRLAESKVNKFAMTPLQPPHFETVPSQHYTAPPANHYHTAEPAHADRLVPAPPLRSVYNCKKDDCSKCDDHSSVDDVSGPFSDTASSTGSTALFEKTVEEYKRVFGKPDKCIPYHFTESPQPVPSPLKNPRALSPPIEQLPAFMQSPTVRAAPTEQDASLPRLDEQPAISQPPVLAAALQGTTPAQNITINNNVRIGTLIIPATSLGSVLRQLGDLCLDQLDNEAEPNDQTDQNQNKATQPAPEPVDRARSQYQHPASPPPPSPSSPVVHRRRQRGRRSHTKRALHAEI